jgi:hypothetical protein
MTRYIVKHRNPAYVDITKQDLWAMDGPFDSDVELAQHLNRCEYAQHDIPYEVVRVDDEQTNEQDSPNETETKKPRRTKRTSPAV